MSEKVTGYILLGAGLLVIIFAALNVYQVFTNQAKPVQVFKFEGIALDASSLIPTDERPRNQAETQAPKMELISGSMINESSNLFIHLFLMGFVASVGYKIASLGVMLLRPINVAVKSKVI